MHTARLQGQQRLTQEVRKGNAMSDTLRNDADATETAVADAFLRLSKVYLASIQRLSALNLIAAREAVERYAAATKALSESNPASNFSDLPSDLIQPMWEEEVTHSRSTYETIAKTQEEMSNLIKGQLAQSHTASAGLAGWNDMSDMLTKRGEP
jgi:phasin family protein